MISVAVALALVLQEPEKPKPLPTGPKSLGSPQGLKRLYDQIAKNHKGERYLKASATMAKTNKTANGIQVASTAELYFRAEDKEGAGRALMWIETEAPPEGKPIEIRTLITADTATVYYPSDRMALVYDLNRDGNLPWQWALWRGIGPELDNRFKLTLEKDPRPEKPKEEPKEDPAVGTTHEDGVPSRIRDGVVETAVMLVDPMSLDRYILDLDPRGSRQKSQTIVFTAFVHPDSLRTDRIVYEDRAERLIVVLADWKVVEEIEKAKFEIDLKDVKVRNR